MINRTCKGESTVVLQTKNPAIVINTGLRDAVKNKLVTVPLEFFQNSTDTPDSAR